jgi:hypothetical protein
MKILTLIAAAVAVMALNSCSSSKNAAQSDYQYQQWLAQQNQQSSSYGAKEVQRQQDKCVTMALDPTATNLRAYGEARGFDESAVTDQAIMTAQERMANSIKTSIATTAEKYTRTARQNINSSTENVFQQLSKRVSDAEINNTRMIGHSVYDSANGQVHIYVCIEMNTTKEQLCEKAVDVLSEGGIEGVLEHRNQFKQEMLGELGNASGAQ